MSRRAEALAVDLSPLAETLDVNLLPLAGRVSGVVGLSILSRGPAAGVGHICRICPPGGDHGVAAEVIGFREREVVLMPLGDLNGIRPGWEVLAERSHLELPTGDQLLGRVLDGLGRPMDGRGVLDLRQAVPVDARAPGPLERAPIREPISVGVRAIDGLLTCGRGQRLGIFAGSGVGKSTLLGMIARHTSADVIVIGLVGERGREVGEFIEHSLGPALARSVVVAATSDQPAVVRLKSAFVATAIAESFRDRGRHVLLLIDSITRVAMAQREIGLAAGEPPATRGYPPSVFACLPRLLERSGNGASGSITGFYTVLVDGDDMNEPISDAVRGILDGHVVLSRDLASRNHYPAIDVLQSVSRLMPSVTGPRHLALAGEARRLLAAYRGAEDLIAVGAYKPGTSSEIDAAVRHQPALAAFLRQGVLESSTVDEAVARLEQILGRADGAPGGGQP